MDCVPERSQRVSLSLDMTAVSGFGHKGGHAMPEVLLGDEVPLIADLFHPDVCLVGEFIQPVPEEWIAECVECHGNAVKQVFIAREAGMEAVLAHQVKVGVLDGNEVIDPVRNLLGLVQSGCVGDRLLGGMEPACGNGAVQRDGLGDDVVAPQIEHGGIAPDPVEEEIFAEEVDINRPYLDVKNTVGGLTFSNQHWQKAVL